MVYLIVLWIASGIGAMMIASSKGHSGLRWLVAGLLIGPLALLIIGFMDRARGTEAIADEMMVVSVGKVKVTTHRLIVENRVFPINQLERVAVVGGLLDKFVIHLMNHTGTELHSIVSDDGHRLKKIADGINTAIDGPSTPTTPVAEAAPAPKVVSVGDVLVELKQLLDSGLISAEEYERKRTEILGRL